MVTGDGDGLSIGGNHLIHALRRNVDLKIFCSIIEFTVNQGAIFADLGNGQEDQDFAAGQQSTGLFRSAGAGAGLRGAMFVARSNRRPTCLHLGKALLAQAALAQGVRHSSRFTRIASSSTTARQRSGDVEQEKQKADKAPLLLEHGKPFGVRQGSPTRHCVAQYGAAGGEAWARTGYHRKDLLRTTKRGQPGVCTVRQWKTVARCLLRVPGRDPNHPAAQ